MVAEARCGLIRYDKALWLCNVVTQRCGKIGTGRRLPFVIQLFCGVSRSDARPLTLCQSSAVLFDQLSEKDLTTAIKQYCVGLSESEWNNQAI